MKYEVKCAWCGKEYELMPITPGAQYCSDACFADAREEFSKEIEAEEFCDVDAD